MTGRNKPAGSKEKHKKDKKDRNKAAPSSESVRTLLVSDVHNKYELFDSPGVMGQLSAWEGEVEGRELTAEMGVMAGAMGGLDALSQQGEFRHVKIGNLKAAQKWVCDTYDIAQNDIRLQSTFDDTNNPKKVDVRFDYDCKYRQVVMSVLPLEIKGEKGVMRPPVGKELEAAAVCPGVTGVKCIFYEVRDGIPEDAAIDLKCDRVHVVIANNVKKLLGVDEHAVSVACGMMIVTVDPQSFFVAE